MVKHNLRTSVVLNGPRTAEELTYLKNAVNDIASQAFAHISRAHELLANKNNDCRNLILMNAVPSVMFLDHLRDVDFDPIAAEQLKPSYYNLTLQVRLLKLYYISKFEFIL
jgi:hypothetical protein